VVTVTKNELQAGNAFI